MAVLVLALGALMSICGIASIFYGAGIVTDKDWVSVLGGVVALSGGIGTLALGLVLQTLLDMRDTMRTAGGLGEPARHMSQVQAPQAHATLVHAADEPVGPPDAPPPHRGEPSKSLMTPELESGMLAAILSSHEAHDSHRDDTHSSVDGSGAPSHEGNAERQAHRDLVEPREHDDRNYPFPEPETEPAANPSRFKVSFKGEVAHEPGPHEPEKTVLPEHDGPAMDDWLDREFSALDAEMPPLAPIRHNEPEPAAHHDPDATHADPTPASPHDGPPRHDDSLHTPSSSVAIAEPAVIGRYEADGTVYVMFADGSIEAQSGAGIFRFNSMTELKSHIESVS